MKDDGVLIFGYHTRPENRNAALAISFRLQVPIANLLRKIRGRKDQQPIEIGNHLYPHTANFHHNFVEQEITDELRQAGFEVLEHGNTWFGWTAARVTKIEEKPSPEMALSA
jgi:hypothetical protein